MSTGQAHGTQKSTGQAHGTGMSARHARGESVSTGHARGGLMSTGHAHGTSNTVTGAHRGRLAVVFGITLAVLVVEVVGGLLSGSLALLADAAHMGADAAGIGVALLATTLAQRPATMRRTFGWQRGEVLAAAGNGLLLIVLAVFIVVEAIRRLVSPGEVETGLMLGVAVLGLVANGVGLALLRRGRQVSLNVRGAYLEVLGDLLGSAAVVVAAVVIALTGWVRADAVASLAVACLVVPRAIALLVQALDVLLEATPRGVDLDHVRAHILEVPGVVEVHDLHAWTITSGLPVLSAHVVVEDRLAADGCGTQILDQLSACLGDHFDVEHCTFQIEPVRHRGHERPVCH